MNVNLNEIPEAWHCFQFKNFLKMIINLDPTSSGKISGPDLLTYICLLDTPVIKTDELVTLQAKLKEQPTSDSISRSNFSSVKKKKNN